MLKFRTTRVGFILSEYVYEVRGPWMFHCTSLSSDCACQTHPWRQPVTSWRLLVEPKQMERSKNRIHKWNKKYGIKGFHQNTYTHTRDFPGGPVVKILHFQGRRQGFWSPIGELRSPMPTRVGQHTNKHKRLSQQWCQFHEAHLCNHNMNSWNSKISLTPESSWQLLPTLSMKTDKWGIKEWTANTSNKKGCLKNQVSHSDSSIFHSQYKECATTLQL